MLLIISLSVILCPIILTKSQSNVEKIQMTIAPNNNGISECTGYNKTYVFNEGTTVKCVLRSDGYINHAWKIVTNNYSQSSSKDYSNLADHYKNDRKILEFEEITLNVSHEGQWQFKILNHIGAPIPVAEKYGKDNFTVTNCEFRLNVTQIPGFFSFWKLLTDQQKYMYIGIGVSLFVVGIIIIQTGIIVHYKAKAQAARVHQNLSMNRASNDKARYCVGFTRKPSNRDSGLYETLEDVKLQRSIAPIPPGLETLPKKAGKSASAEELPMALMSKSLSSTRLLPEGSCDESHRIQNRPPLDLPEEYEEVGSCDTYEAPPENLIEENTYEAPPEPEPHKAPVKPIAKKPQPPPPACRNIRLNTVNPSELSPSTRRKNPKREEIPWNSTIPKSCAKKTLEKNPMAAELNSILQRRNGGQSILNPHTGASSTNVAPNGSLPKKTKVQKPPPTKTKSNAPGLSLFKNPTPSSPPKLETPKQGLPVAKPIPPRPNKKASPTAPICPAAVAQRCVPPADPLKAPRNYNELNSSDEEWVYEELPEINLNKPAPRRDVEQVAHAQIPQLIPPAQPIEEPTYFEPNSSDEEWMYEALPEIQLKKPRDRNNK